VADSRPTAGSLDIRSEAHGPHWVAWIAGADGKPHRNLLIMGETQEEAESKARQWAEQTSY
jgi:hypothetical protein